MKILKTISVVLILTALILSFPDRTTHAQQNGITPDDLIYLVNTIRTANKLPALRVDSILMNTAQDTAETMAAENLTWHIGKPGERIQAAGYGTGYNVWATENFAMSWGDYSLTEIQQEWADATHMIPMVNPAYCDIGAGVAAAADGTVYYIVHAAYTSAGSCGKYQSPIVEKNVPEPTNPTEPAALEPENAIEYTVDSGDSLWQIAVDNDTTTAIIKQLNELDSDSIYVGQKLLVPAPDRLTPTVTATAISPTATPRKQSDPTQTDQPQSPTKPIEPTQSSQQNTDVPQPTATAAVSESGTETPTPPSAANPILFWQIFAGIEFLALGIITFFFWQPWIQKQPVKPGAEQPETWHKPDELG